MNNKMVVAVRSKDLSPLVYDQAVKAVAIDEGMNLESIYKHEQTNTWVYATGGLDQSHMDMVLSCLEDHMENIPEEELDDITGNLWGGCIKTEHIHSDVECYSCLPDCIAVNVGTFEYFGPNCVVDVYYISE